MAKIIYYLFILFAFVSATWLLCVIIQEKSWLMLIVPIVGYYVAFMMWYIRKSIFEEDDTDVINY